MIKLSTIKSNPNNPRIIKNEMFKSLVKSLQEMPDMMELRPIVTDKDNMVMGGNMRLKALIELNYTEIPDSWIKKHESFTPEQWQEFIIKDNVSFGEWNWDDLKKGGFGTEEQLKSWGVELFEEEEKNLLSKNYVHKDATVIYEPKNTNHKPTDLYELETKFNTEIEEIENAEIKDLLKLRVSFFCKLNFSKIADYYAYQATDKEKRIFEKLALVLLDKEQLIENGFSKLISDLDRNDYE